MSVKTGLSPDKMSVIKRFLADKHKIPQLRET